MAPSLVAGHNDYRIAYGGHWVVLPFVHFSTEQNATATFNFDGSAVSIAGTIGMVETSTLPLSVTLDGQDVGPCSFDGHSPHTLYSSQPLRQGHHTLSLALLTNTSFLSIEGMLIGTGYVEAKVEPPPLVSRTRSRLVEIVCGAVVGTIIVVLAMAFALFIYLRRRKRHTILNSAGPLRVVLPTTKEAFTSPNHCTYGLSFFPYDPGYADNYTQLPPKKSRSRLKRHDPIYRHRRMEVQSLNVGRHQTDGMSNSTTVHTSTTATLF